MRIVHTPLKAGPPSSARYLHRSSDRRLARPRLGERLHGPASAARQYGTPRHAPCRAADLTLQSYWHSYSGLSSFLSSVYINMFYRAGDSDVLVMSDRVHWLYS
ncbi:hypothetical protein J6590_013223 [Homalodisca vitripennis]|nr:hypothetical protein J6590_013223 [Homalodisca vitripennis]